MHDRSSAKRVRSTRSGDAVNDALQYLRLAEGTYCRCELARPWGLSFPRQDQARFHFVVAGNAWLREPQSKWTALHAGDAILLPHGTGHAIADRARGTVTPLDDMPLETTGDGTFRMRTSGAAPLTVLVCCSIRFDQPLMRPLLESMPKVLFIRGQGARDPVLQKLIECMALEMMTKRIGAASVMTRLADVLITHIVRAWAESRADETTGWLTAMSDPQIGKALAAIHDRPGDPWSLASLARVARASRSAFVERFSALVGMPPGRYLARFRMETAAGWLRTERVTVAEAAHRLGYESEAAFSRAFKRFAGVAPSTVRRSGLVAAKSSSF